MTVEKLNKTRAALLVLLAASIVAFFTVGCMSPAEPATCVVEPIQWHQASTTARLTDSLSICLAK